MSTTVLDAFNSVRETAEKNLSNERRVRRFSEACSDEDYIRHGDIYVYYRESRPDGLVAAKPDPKLVEGTSEGAQHILDSVEGVEFFKLKNPTPLHGPRFYLTEQRTITHPRHDHVLLDISPGWYEIDYQRMQAEEIRRVQD